MLTKLMRYLNRNKLVVDFASLTTTTPVSRVFGLDRGTPINRYYIEKFLASQAASIRGRVLEVGASDYSRRFGGVGAAVASCIAYWFAVHGACFLFKPLHRTGWMLTRAMFYPKVW